MFAQYNDIIPDDKDFEGSAAAIVRLQDVYRLNASDIISGKLKGSPYLGATLSWFDCYVIGKAAYDDEEYHKSYEWMKIIDQLDNFNISSKSRVGILSYMAYSAYKVSIYISTTITLYYK